MYMQPALTRHRFLCFLLIGVGRLLVIKALLNSRVVTATIVLAGRTGGRGADNAGTTGQPCISTFSVQYQVGTLVGVRRPVAGGAGTVSVRGVVAFAAGNHVTES